LLNKKLLESILYSKIVSWGVNDIIVVIVFDRNSEIIKYYFETPQVNTPI